MTHRRQFIRLILVFLVLAFAGSAFAQRCAATTKKGTQCKRSAASGSSYCWQHGGSSSSSSDRSTYTPPPPRTNALEAPADTTKSSKVAITRTGKKYHRETCSYLKGGYSMIPLSQAKETYTPCSKCKP